MTTRDRATPAGPRVLAPPAASDPVGRGRTAPPVRLTLPWTPCAVPDNAAYRAVPSRGVLLSKRGREAKAAIFAEAFKATRGRLLSGRLALQAIAFPPDDRRRDVGNLRKLLTDALQGAVYADDAQLVHEAWTLGPVARDWPRIEVTVLEAAR